jgi:hypothetical protein
MTFTGGICGEPLDFALPAREDDEIDRWPSYLTTFWRLAGERYVEVRKDRLDRPERRQREGRSIRRLTDIRVVTLRRSANPPATPPPSFLRMHFEHTDQPAER